MALSEAQKKFLRGLGHQLKPVVTVGEAGLSPSLLAEFESTLSHHELIKVRVRAATRAQRDEMIQQLCASGSAEIVQRIGNIALLYRANPERSPEKRLRLPSS